VARKPSPKSFHLPPSQAGDFLAHKVVVLVEERTPAAITKLDARFVESTISVSITVVRMRSASTSVPRAGHELLDSSSMSSVFSPM
jgi:hypothetical protein